MQSMATNRILREIEDLDEPAVVPEEMFRLGRGRVVLANYDRLCQDFPQLGRLERADIDAWLVHHAGLISAPQAAQTEVNSAIPVAERAAAYRPPRYGRAAVVAVADPPGLLDIKGIGVRPGVKPRTEPHRNGLLSLDWLLTEVFNQELLDRVFAHSGADVRTVPWYAVLDAGFDVWENYGSGYNELLLRPAGILVRRAHLRPPGNVELPAHGTPEQAAAFQIEMLLRHYGLTSTGTHTSLHLRRADGERAVFRGREPIPCSAELFDWIAGQVGDGAARIERPNVQTTRSPSTWPLRVELVDLSSYRGRQRFASPLLSPVRDRPLSWGGVLLPDDPLFVQPDPRLAISAELWENHPVDEATARALEVRPDLQLQRDVTAFMLLVSGWRRGEVTSDRIAAAMNTQLAETWHGRPS
jgi:hypothetical protein